MKKIIFYIVLFFIGLFTFFSDAKAIDTITVGNDIFKEDISHPYCFSNGKYDSKKCSLETGIEEVKGKVEGIEKEGTAVGYIQEVISYVLGFLFVITVILIIWAGFMILTAAGNDDKIDNAKKIIKNSIIGLIVIFLAYAITDFIVTTLSSSTITKKSTTITEVKNTN